MILLILGAQWAGGHGVRPGWWSLAPPLVAILLAVHLRNVVVALFLGVWSGVLLLHRGDAIAAALRTVDTYLVDELVPSSEAGHAHMHIVLFTLFLGAMVGVMARSGGSRALVERLARWTSTRRRGQLTTWALGLVVFFDDYANTLLLGTTLRPVADRLRISREKLAFLVDATAAPVAGLAVVSTWVGFEVGQIDQAFGELGVSWNAYSAFLATIPYRFYPLLLLAFVVMIAGSGRDFGPMHRAEVREHAAPARADTAFAGASGAALRKSEGHGQGYGGDSNSGNARRPLMRNALVPIAALLGLLLFGLGTTGLSGLEAANAARRAAGEPPLPMGLWSILAAADSNRVLLLSSFTASAVALVSAGLSGALTLEEGMEAWFEGAREMLLPVAILVLAWSVATVCDAEHLNTAGFLVEATRGGLSQRWMPALAFVTSAVVSFATGSSFSTMGLLIPLFVRMAYTLLTEAGAVPVDNDPALLGTIGAVLAGAIFGDHCSPISDTTVLSSAAAGCHHLDHVTTQLPYAACVGGVSLLCGYVPIGFGVSPWVSLPVGMGALFVLVRFCGKRPTFVAGEREA